VYARKGRVKTETLNGSYKVFIDGKCVMELNEEDELLDEAAWAIPTTDRQGLQAWVRGLWGGV
jgi:hypothetical protein